MMLTMAEYNDFVHDNLDICNMICAVWPKTLHLIGQNKGLSDLILLLFCFDFNIL